MAQIKGIAVKVTTLNIDGFFGNLGRTESFLKVVKQSDITFLQELKIKEKDKERFVQYIQEHTGNNFEIKFCYNRHLEAGDHTNGVATIVKKSLRAAIFGEKKDPFGRYISIDIRIGKNYLRLINIYVPVQIKSKPQFLNEIAPLLTTNKPIIMAGDTNTYFTIDDAPSVKRGSSTEEVKHAKLFTDLVKSALLVDAYKFLNPPGPDYTHVQTYKDENQTKKVCYSRIDHVFVHKTVKAQIQKIECYTVAGTDHRAIQMFFIIPDIKEVEQQSSLKIGKELCEDEQFCQEIRSYYNDNKMGNAIPKCHVEDYNFLAKKGRDMRRVNMCCGCIKRCENTHIHDLFWWLRLKEGFLSIAKYRQNIINREKRAEIENLYASITRLENLETRKPNLSGEIQEKIAITKSQIITIFKTRAEKLKQTQYGKELKEADLPTATFSK